MIAARRALPAAGVTLAIVVAIVLGVRRWSGGEGDRDRTADEGAGGAAAIAATTRADRSAGSRALRRPVVEADAVRAAAAPSRVRVRRGAVLARVNDVAITLAELVALPAGSAAEHELDADAYQALLDRAIEGELARQAAAAAGVGLDDVQARSLAEVRARPDGAAREPGTTFDALGRDAAAAAALEARDLEGVMLLDNLTAHAGGPPALVTGELARREHDAHPERYGPWPTDAAARAALEARIRADLAPTVAAAHHAAVRELVGRLRAAADIETAPVP